MRKRCQAPRPGSSSKSVMEHGISRFGTGGPALGLLSRKTSLWWAGAFWLCRRNASAHMWLYVFGLSRVHHPKSLCKLFVQGVLEDMALAGVSSSGLVQQTRFVIWMVHVRIPAFSLGALATSALQTHPDSTSFPLQRLRALRVWITPCSFSAK